MANSVAFWFLPILESAQPECSPTNNIPRDMSIRQPLGMSSPVPLGHFDELVLLTLDDVPTGCNLHLVAVSLTASHRCNLTLGLLHKYDSEWYNASRASTIPHKQSQRSLDSITPCEFSVTGDYQLNRSLYLFLGLNRAHCSYNILANNQLNSPVLKSTRMEGRDLFAYLSRRISWRPIVTYHFRGQSYLVRIVDSEQMAVK